MADDRFEPCRCGDPGNHVEGPTTGDYYLICLAYTETRCGQEDVYGHLCGDACTTATDRPYVREGVTVRAIALSVTEPLPDSRAVPFSRIHLRSRLASALFAQEVHHAAGSLISKAGLGEDAWCLGSALAGDDCVPLAVLARSGNTNVFLDAWSVRRERIEAPSRRYWAWRMRMRPWDVFLAQVLQFQCQLAGIAVAHPHPGELDDPCAPHIAVVDEAQSLLEEIRRYYTQGLAQHDPAVVTSDHPIALAGGLERIDQVHDQLGRVLKGVYQSPRDRVLIDGGIVELPSAGYLPVDNASTLSVNDQVRRLLGGGLDLRFCVVRPDYVAHALEEAQHMDRISLTYGLDHLDDRPKVDILVPDGSIAVGNARSATRSTPASRSASPRPPPTRSVASSTFSPQRTSRIRRALSRARRPSRRRRLRPISQTARAGVPPRCAGARRSTAAARNPSSSERWAARRMVQSTPTAG